MPVEGSKREKAVEIRLALQDIGVPKDIVVTTPGDFECHKEIVDTIERREKERFRMTASEHLLVVTRAWIEKAAFIVNCRDDATTRHGAQRFFEWLAQTGEETLVSERAKARARIVCAIAKELEKAEVRTKSEK